MRILLQRYNLLIRSSSRYECLQITNAKIRVSISSSTSPQAASIDFVDQRLELLIWTGQLPRQPPVIHKSGQYHTTCTDHLSDIGLLSTWLLSLCRFFIKRWNNCQQKAQRPQKLQLVDGATVIIMSHRTNFRSSPSFTAISSLLVITWLAAQRKC